MLKILLRYPWESALTGAEVLYYNIIYRKYLKEQTDEKSLLHSTKNAHFDVICVDFLKGANKECECSYQDANNAILKGVYLHLYMF